MSNGETDLGTLERHYRVTLDFRLLAGDITPALCQESFFFSEEATSADEGYFKENIERQQRLYILLRNNREVLEQYLLSVLAQDVEKFVCEGLRDALSVQEEDDLLISLYRKMEENDARFFEECRELNALAENTELISLAFKVYWVGVEVEEISRRTVGDVKRAEVVKQTIVRLIRRLNSSR